MLDHTVWSARPIRDLGSCIGSLSRLAFWAIMNGHMLFHGIYRVSIALVTTTLIPCAGCRTWGSRRDAPPTHLDQLMYTYPELGAGRFVVIADFEDPKHMELFRTVDASGRAGSKLDRKKGRAETGGGCLLVTLGSGDDAVVISNAAADQWYLKRDWRPYDILLISIYAPARDLTAQIAIAGGPAERRLAAQTSLRLHRGWNILRLDLAEAGERIPLDDVQEIRLAVEEVRKPIQLRVDDILLTASREDLLGDSEHRDQGLYVRRVGRRWSVGAAELGTDFELTFANGQIVEWYNLAADPYQLHNLVQGTALGPSIVGIGSGGKPEQGFDALGKAVVVRSKIVEMSPVRVVVTSEWRFVDEPGTADRGLEDCPFQRWVFTIYPTGELYVGVDATTATETWSAPPLGLAVSVFSESGDRPELNVVSQHPSGSVSEDLVPYATLRSRDHNAFLLFTPDAGERPFEISVVTPETDPLMASVSRTTLIATGQREEGNVEQWACHLLLGAAGEIPEQEALRRAVAYVEPPAPELQIGVLPPADVGYRAESGFDPVSGCYNLVPEYAGVRFIIDGTQQPWFSPVFRILATDNQVAWVYVDHLIHERMDRDAHGNLVFQIPGQITRRSLVEVVFSHPEGSEGG